MGLWPILDPFFGFTSPISKVIVTSVSFCWGLATKLFLLFTFFFLGTYAYHNLNKQIHKNKNLSEPLKNSQLFNGINSLGFHKNSLGWIFMCLNLATDLLLVYLFLMKRIGFSLLHMMNCVKNIIVEKWWDLLTGFIRESLSTQKISYPINAIVY